MATTTLPAQSGPGPDPSVRVEAAGSSPDEAMATLPGMYSGKHWYSTTTDGPYSYRYVAVGDESLTLRRSRLHGFIRGEVHIGGDYVVHWLTGGSVVLDTLGEPIPLAPLRPNLSPDGEDFVFEAADFDARLVHIDRALVHEVASERTGTAVRSLQLTPHAPARPDALTTWRGALADATAVINERDAAPLAWHDATRAVAAAFLGLYPPHEVAPPHPGLLHPRNARIRAAVEYVHAHVAEPLTVARIAVPAGLSVRSTHEGFQRILGVTPMHYVRDLRLGRVRDDLLAADPADTTVAMVARRWGFVNLGRFSATYRQRFGEFPRDTLRR